VPALAECSGPPQPARRDALGTSYPNLEPVDSSPARSAPLSRCTLLRHSSFVRAVCVNALVRICAGGDQGWSSLPRQCNPLKSACGKLQASQRLRQHCGRMTGNTEVGFVFGIRIEKRPCDRTFPSGHPELALSLSTEAVPQAIGLESPHRRSRLRLRSTAGGARAHRLPALSRRRPLSIMSTPFGGCGRRTAVLA
jgi:hypothetical protein